jgi:hypothetical protein
MLVGARAVGWGRRRAMEGVAPTPGRGRASSRVLLALSTAWPDNVPYAARHDRGGPHRLGITARAASRSPKPQRQVRLLGPPSPEQPAKRRLVLLNAAFEARAPAAWIRIDPQQTAGSDGRRLLAGYLGTAVFEDAAPGEDAAAGGRPKLQLPGDLSVVGWASETRSFRTDAPKASTRFMSRVRRPSVPDKRASWSMTES